MQRLSELAAVLGVPLVGADAIWAGASIDTRQLEAGQLFVALPGSRVDGHDFLRKAASLGAAGALVARRIDCELPQLVVAEVLPAMQALAAAWRRHWQGLLVAVTGSNGKTSVKNLLAGILRQRGPAFATAGNLNNHIGVPLSLLNLRPEQRRAVLELGANHAGEIAALAALAQPQIGIVTQAGDAHLEGFGSREGVARAKGELFAALAADGTAILNADDAYADYWRGLTAHCRRLEFGRDPAATVRAEGEQLEASGSRFELRIGSQRGAVRLALEGRHNVMNALAAAAAASAAEFRLEEIVAGLATVSPAAGRLLREPRPGGGWLIDDSYNANPTSVAAAIETLAGLPGPRHLVFGDMGELGETALAAHAEVGRQARAAGLDALWTCGPLSAAAAESFGAGAQAFKDRDALWAALAPALPPAATVLVKGSRSAAMDQIAQRLREH